MKNLVIAGLLLIASMPVCAFDNATEARTITLQNRARPLNDQKDELIKSMENAINDSVQHGRLSAVINTDGYTSKAQHEAIIYFREKGYYVSAFGGFLAPAGFGVHWDEITTSMK